MFSSDFRQITLKGEASRTDRLFRAAVSAFCSLPRPSRREIVQLEDLALPLFDHVSIDSKRYVAAALSECAHPPVVLIRRLAEETVDVAAPLLIRSVALTDIDLIALISRHGYDHARAIARRPRLNPVIGKLIGAIERKVEGSRANVASLADRPKVIAISTGTGTDLDAHRSPGQAEESARRRLRAMMLPASSSTSTPGVSARSHYARLRDSALSGYVAFFHTALADALDKDFASVRDIGDNPSYDWLIDALRTLDVSDEKAFLVTAAIYPSLFGDLQAIRLFLLRYAAVSRDEALERIGRWKTTEAERRRSQPSPARAAS